MLWRLYFLSGVRGREEKREGEGAKVWVVPTVGSEVVWENLVLTRGL